MVHMRPLLLLAALGGSVLGGCTLIDQRTFNPRAGLGPAPPPSPGPPPPLIAIDFDKAAPVFEAPLRQAVAQALARKPSVAFDVATIVPATGTLAQQIAAASALRGDAREVARIIAGEGVEPDRIRLLARAEPGAASRQVQVFVH